MPETQLIRLSNPDDISSQPSASFGGGGGSPWSAAADIIVGGINAWQQARQNKKNREFYEEQQQNQNAFNASQAEEAYRRQRELYDYQFNKETSFEKDYNSPLAQMQRYQAAGLNPALMMQSGDAGNISPAATPSGVASATASNPSVPQFVSPFSAMLGSLGSIVNLTKILSEVNLNEGNLKKIDKEVDKIVADKNLSEAERDKVREETNTLVYRLKNILPKEYDKYVADIESVVSNTQNQRKLTAANLNEIEYKVKEIISKIPVNEATASKLQSELDGYDDYIRNVYRREAYRADLDYTEYEYSSALRGARTQFIQSLRSGDLNEAIPLMLIIALIQRFGITR